LIEHNARHKYKPRNYGDYVQLIYPGDRLREFGVCKFFALSAIRKLEYRSIERPGLSGDLYPQVGMPFD
jgi:hypothetical protein